MPSQNSKQTNNKKTIPQSAENNLFTPAAAGFLLSCFAGYYFFTRKGLYICAANSKPVRTLVRKKEQ